ncbi:MAG: hypothetical protein DRQ49_02405 [Gammaproteobacteria bacterium]|nr:MAG: hypothetical protein DRQ41_10465 [Gammaproteobacteria bacterium]RKZ42319.1 MAG: hypothetical protein DRQ49_02405 [Gammaproteobacteria bacterium]RKZ73300.1 MAG: hypothetical protein DRQ57_14785 [Gammaproteobacteria bacterium]
MTHYQELRRKILFLVFFLSHHIYADEIHLNNGDRISGHFVHLSSRICTFATPYQTTLDMKRSQILRLRVVQPVMVELYSGERLIGTLNSTQDGVIFLQSQNLGEFTLQLVDIKNISTIKSKKSIFSENWISTWDNLQGKGLGGIPQPGSSESTSPETVGEKDDEKLRRLLLQKTAVLLEAGEQEIEFALNYSNDLANGVRQRTLTFPFAYHYGFTNRLEAFINLPLSWAEQTSSSDSDFNKNNALGISDIRAGFSYLLRKEDKNFPDMIGLFNVTAPTGHEPNPTDSDHVPLGSGHWRITTGLTLVRTYDPATLFGGMAYTHTLANTFNDGVRVSPGDSLTYRFGMGFSINYQLAGFSQLLGIYQTDTKHDNVKILGSAREPMLFETGIIYALDRKRFLQSAVTFGLNDEAVDVSLDLSYIHRF